VYFLSYIRRIKFVFRPFVYVPYIFWRVVDFLALRAGVLAGCDGAFILGPSVPLDTMIGELQFQR